jgi:anthranilate/para-aminobenzoate synthase component I
MVSDGMVAARWLAAAAFQEVVRARRVPAPPRPIELARRLEAAGLGQVALLHGDDGAVSWIGAAPDRASSALDPVADDDAPPDGRHFGEVPRWIGVIPYEARRGLERPAWRREETRPAPLFCEPSWSRYPTMVRVDGARGEVAVIGAGAMVERFAAALARPAPPLPAVVLDVSCDEAAAVHAARVARARELILAGDLYQVNVARRLRVAVTGSPLAVYRELRARAPSPYGASIDFGGRRALASTSPELLLRAEPRPVAASPGFGRLVTAPIKGTRPRGRDASADAALARALDADPKERAELAMIVDVERNDLASVCVPGSVRVVGGPAVETHRTLHHRVARLSGFARADASRTEVIAAMVPSGSVTGAPKVRAMEVIAELEPHRRGLYTGAIGFVARDGAITLSMAIRTLEIGPTEACYFTGGGIVADSDPEMEVRETEWKAAQLTHGGNR